MKSRKNQRSKSPEGRKCSKKLGRNIFAIGREIFARDGAKGLAKCSKVHFKTFNEIVEKSAE
jgi:ribonuclease HIII